MILVFVAAIGKSLPVREAWIEIEKSTKTYETCLSLPVREAWIEIPPAGYEFLEYVVAPRKGSVD